MFAKKNFEMTGSTNGEFKHFGDLGNEVTRGFCTLCGSSVYQHNTGTPEYLSVTLGTLDDSSDLNPEVVVFSCNRKPWDAMDETIESFDTQPEWSPNAGS